MLKYRDTGNPYKWLIGIFGDKNQEDKINVIQEDLPEYENTSSLSMLVTIISGLAAGIVVLYKFVFKRKK